MRGVKITPRGCNFTPKRELVEALPIAKDVIPSVGGTEVALSAVTAGNCGLTLCVTAFVVGAIVLITLLATGGGASSSSAVSKIYWLSDTSKKAIEGSNWLLGQCDEITSFWGAVLSPVWALLFGPP